MASGEVIGVDEVAHVGSQPLMGLIEVAFDGRVFDGAVHSLDLAAGPVLGASVFEGVRPSRFSGVEGRLDVRRG